VTLLNELAAAESADKQFAKAERHLRRARAITAKLSGPMSSAVMLADYRIGQLHYRQAQTDDAAKAFKSALAIAEKIDGPVAELTGAIGHTYADAGRYAEAKAHFSRNLEIVEGKHGKDDLQTSAALIDLGNAEFGLGRFREAAELYTRAGKIRFEKLDKYHPDLGRALENIALANAKLGHTKLAETYYQLAIKVFEKQGPGNALLRQVKGNLAQLYHSDGRKEEAARLFGEMLTD
jgi:tetratricopeptide (TPR) repeat protein